jgi:hypothetical protein
MNSIGACSIGEKLKCGDVVVVKWSGELVDSGCCCGCLRLGWWSEGRTVKLVHSASGTLIQASQLKEPTFDGTQKDPLSQGKRFIWEFLGGV